MLSYSAKLAVKKIIMLIKHPILSSANKHSRFYIGKNMILRGGGYKRFLLGAQVQFGTNLKVKFLSDSGTIQIYERCYFGDFISLYCSDSIVIEKDVLFASHIFITTENHSFDPENPHSYGHQPLKSAPIHFKTGSWIGENVTFISSGDGLTIGKKCVIAAGSVVTKSIPDYSMVAGVPARVIKQYNFDTHCWERT